MCISTSAQTTTHHDAKHPSSSQRGESPPGPRKLVSLPVVLVTLIVAAWGSYKLGEGCQVLRHHFHGQIPFLEAKQAKFHLNTGAEHPANKNNTFECQVDGSGCTEFGAAAVNNSEDWDDDYAVEEDHDEIKDHRYVRHLIVDIQHVDSHFLDSPQCLIEAMKASAAESGTILAAHYCSQVKPVGVSCAGEFQDNGRVTFRTWPEAGVITLDWVTFSESSPLPSLDRVHEIFGLPANGEDIRPDSMVWFILPRARPQEEVRDSNDLEQLLKVKKIPKSHVASTKTFFQSIDVYDAQGIPKEEFPISNKIKTQQQQYEPLDRRVFLDGVMQSRSLGEAAYHEALVHPVLFLHDCPKRVAIIGGGEGATLRELLKHKSVEEAVMIEIDEAMVDFSRTHLPEWSDCSSLAGSRPSCFDDPRVQVYYEDAIAWFIDRFQNEDEVGDKLFDVIIMDAL
jgi:S-adenosylmethionine/arginine decarboxylase-like enzyme